MMYKMFDFLENCMFYVALFCLEWCCFNRVQTVEIGTWINDPLTAEQVESLLNKAATQLYLSGFTSEAHNTLVSDYLRYCPYNNLCGFSFELSYPNTMKSCCAECSCFYPDCLANRSCCVDILPPELAELVDEATYSKGADSRSTTRMRVNQNGNSPKEAVDKFYDQEPIIPQCRLMHAKHLPQKGQVGRLVIASCPFNSELKSKCEQVYSFDNVFSVNDMVPVTDIVNNNTYRNKYCAQCNNVSTVLVKWRVNLSLNKGTYRSEIGYAASSLLELVLKRNRYDLWFDLVGYQPPPKCEPLLNQCNWTGSWARYDPLLEANCAVFASGYAPPNSIANFQNFYCFKCNGFPLATSFCNPGYDIAAYPYAFSGLVSSIEKTSEENLPDQNYQNKCQHSYQVHDPILNKCKSPTCSNFHFLEKERCRRLFNVIGTNFYTVHIRLSPKSAVSLKFIHSIMPNIQLDLQEYMNTEKKIEGLRVCRSQIYFTLVKRLGQLEKANVKDLSETKVRHINFIYNMTVIEAHSPYDVADHFTSLNGNTMELWVCNTSTFFLITIVENASAPFEIGTTPFENLTSYALLDELQQAMLPFQTLHYQVACGYLPEFANIATTRDCPTITIEKTNRNWKETRYGVYFDLSNFSLNYSEFYFKNEIEINVCKDVFMAMLGKEEVHIQKTHASVRYEIDIEQALSIACISVSILCLIVTIVVFLAIPSLMTLPGLNTVTLATSLLVAQCLYVVSSFARLEMESVECVTVGIALHFFSLLAIFWMNICTFHMFRVLTVTQVMSHSFKKKYAIFNSYAVLCSLIPVGTCLAVSFYLSNGKDIGYGLVTCYISSKAMLKFTFVFPVFAVVVSNFIMFTFVVLKVDRGPKNIRANAKQERNDFIIFIKLSSLTGMTWIFGVLYSWLEIKTLSYIFVVLNASQGAFIMISFVVNRRVLKLCKAKVSETFYGTLTTKSVNVSTKSSESASGRGDHYKGQGKYVVRKNEAYVK